MMTLADLDVEDFRGADGVGRRCTWASRPNSRQTIHKEPHAMADRLRPIHTRNHGLLVGKLTGEASCVDEVRSGRGNGIWQ
jgi:hypothetical protein